MTEPDTAGPMSPARRAKLVVLGGTVGVALLALIAGIIVANARNGASGATSLPVSPPVVTSSPVVTPTPIVVPALDTLTPRDVIVTLRHPASAAALRRLRRISGVRTVALLAAGRITVHGVRLHVLGVTLATIRGFTPQLTATSEALWSSVARGELTVGFADSRPLRHDLGDTFTATGPGHKTGPLRIGAFATIGLTGGQGVVSERAARSFGLSPRREVLVAAPKMAIADLTAAVRQAFGPPARIEVTRAAPVDQSESSTYAASTIPAYYLDLYRRAAVTCPGLPWTVLAGIGTVETGNGRDVHRSSAGAEGPMRFLPSTWAVWGYDADGDGKVDINDPVDAVFSAARYLCAAGAGRGGQSLDDAIYSYNHAWWYVREVIVIANEYA